MQDMDAADAWGGYWPWLAFFLIVTGARFLLIAHYGSEVGMEDEWGSVVRELYTPLLEGKLRLGDLFKLWDQHRIFTTRLYELFMLKIDGGVWSPIQQMIGNALIQGATVTGLTLAMWRLCPPAQRQVYYLLSLVLWGLPLAVENVLMGFQTQFYFMLLFSYVFLWSVISAEVLSWQWWLGMSCGALGLLSLASGPLALICGSVFLGLRYWRLGGGRADLLLLLALLLMAGVAMALTPSGHGWAVNPVTEVSWALLRVSSWPAFPGFALILYLPLVRFLWSQLRRPPAASDASWFAFALGLWVVIEFLAISYTRTQRPLATRYDDIFITGLLLSFLLALQREQTVAVAQAALPEAERAPPPYLPFAQLWLLVVLAGTIHNCVFLSQQLDKKLQWSVAAEQNLRGYVQTRDFALLADKPYPIVPYHDALALKAMLDDPVVDSFLPPNMVPANAGRQPWLLREVVAHLWWLGIGWLVAGALILGGVMVRRQEAAGMA